MRFVPVILVAALLASQEVSSQEAASQEVSSREAASSDTVEQRLSAQEEKIQAQEQQIQAMEERHKAEIEALKDRLDAAEEETYDEIDQGAQDFVPSIDVYGFFDLALYRFFIEEGEVMKGFMPHALSFTITNLNLYFASSLADTFRALVELRFTFLPNGSEELVIPPDFNVRIERESTRVVEPLAMDELHLGGVIIERVQLTWQPYDFFGITAGRYITPYGIWNEDHGSPVIIPVVEPYLTTNRFVPPAQTGLMAHGRFFPTDRVFLDYAVTLSNGRGPAEALYDLDDSKALGLRLKLIYEGKKVNASLGGYGFWGQATEVAKRIAIDPDTIFKTEVEETSKYTELTGSLDLLIELYGVRLQAEYAHSLITYDIRPPKSMPFVGVDDPSGAYRPDYARWDFYVLVGWALPLKSLIGDMRLMPFFMFERSVLDDTTDDYNAVSYRFGINFRPEPFLVLKATATAITLPNSDVVSAPMWIAAAQMAVTF